MATNYSRRHWFVQGFAIAFICFAAANAASYFFRSSSISPLFEGNAQADESLGFPFEIWNVNSSLGPFHIQYLHVLLNCLIGAAIGIVVGALAVLCSNQFSRWMENFEANAISQSSKAQFSISGMLGATAIVGLLLSGLTQWAGSRELLWFVYLAGPTLLIAIAFLPRGIRWQSRCVIVAVTAAIVIVSAVWSGGKSGLEFDRVMMGIFVFWTPQSGFAALIGLIAIALWPSFDRPACDGDLGNQS